MDRHLKSSILAEIAGIMILISGPRQCGKTTFARGLFENTEVQYLNGDLPADRKIKKADLRYFRNVNGVEAAKDF